MNSTPIFTPDDGEWLCAECNTPLIQQSTQAFYLDSAFSASLPTCPKCALTLVPKSLAEGKMLEVERLLEDK